MNTRIPYTNTPAPIPPPVVFVRTQAAGCIFGEPKNVEFEGVPFALGPKVVMQPSFATCTDDLRRKAGPGVQVSTNR